MTQQQLRAAGAKLYTLSARCQGNNPAATVGDDYTDLLNLGRIFGVEARARAVVAQMRATVAAVHRRVAGRKPVRILIDSEGRGPIDGFSAGIYNDELRLAGATNASTNPVKDFEMISKEQVAASNPDVFMILDYPGKSVTANAQFLLSTFLRRPA